MESFLHPRIVSVERLEDSAVVTFENGRSALYSASLLYNMISQANEIASEDINDTL